MITNLPTKCYDDPTVATLRLGGEYRGQWLYFLLKALKDHGFDYEAIGRCGIFELGRSNKAGFPDSDDVKDFADTLLAPPSSCAMQIEPVEIGAHEAKFVFGYCPMCAVWQRVTDDQDFIANLCDIAMDVDRGLLSTYSGMKLVLDGGRISAGHCCCDFAVRSK